MKSHSRKITILSFFLILGIVWCHARFPMDSCVPVLFLRLSLVNEIGQDAVSTFLFITGYLFFRGFSMEQYKGKIKSRLRTLAVPYILWNIIFAVVWYFTLRVGGPQYVTHSSDFSSVTSVIGDILATKYTVLWYIGVIMVLAIFSPLFYYLNKTKTSGLLSVVVMFIATSCFHSPFSSPLLWMALYMMAAWVSKYYPDYMFDRQPWKVTLFALILYPISVYLTREYDNMLTTNIRNFVAAFFFIGVYDILDSMIHFREHRVYHYTMFIYAFHYYFVYVGQRILIYHSDSALTHSPSTTDAMLWMAYLVVPVLVMVWSLLVAWLMEKYAKPVYRVLTGGR